MNYQKASETHSPSPFKKPKRPPGNDSGNGHTGNSNHKSGCGSGSSIQQFWNERIMERFIKANLFIICCVAAGLLLVSKPIVIYSNVSRHNSRTTYGLRSMRSMDTVITGQLNIIFFLSSAIKWKWNEIVFAQKALIFNLLYPVEEVWEHSGCNNVTHKVDFYLPGILYLYL